jgi:hypothetical protein
VATFEQLWKRIQLYAPDLPTPLAQEFINNAYSTAFNWWPWSQSRRQIELLIPASEYGLAQFTSGSNTVVGNGTAWTTAILYRQIITDGIAPYYTIVDVDPGAQELTLDRPYGKLTNLNAPFEIGQFYFEVPSDFGYFDTIRDLDNNWKLHTNFVQAQIDVWDTKRTTSGTPWVVASAPPRVATNAEPVIRYELWPRVGPGPKQYTYRYVRDPGLMSNATDRPIWPIGDDALRKGALAELCLWPGTQTAPNLYADLGRYQMLQKDFEAMLTEAWKRDNELSQQAIKYDDWEGVPYAPIDARYLQSHDIF